MAYASVIHVQAANAARPPFGASSIPNLDQVMMFIDQASGEIDAALIKQNYSTPITPASYAAYPTAAMLMLQQANAVGAAYMVEVSAQTGPKAALYKTMWDAALKMLETIELPDVPKNPSRGLPRSGMQATYIFSPGMQL